METLLNKKNYPSRKEKKQIAYRPKNLGVLQGQQVLHDILSPHQEDVISDRVSDEPSESSQLPFEEFGRNSNKEAFSWQSLPPFVSENFQEIQKKIQEYAGQTGDFHPSPNVRVPEGVQLKFQPIKEEEPEVPVVVLSQELTKESAPVVETPVPVRSYNESESTSSIFRLKQGTRKALGVLNDIFGDDTLLSKDASARSISSKSKLFAIFWAILLGFLGAHRAYLGHFKKIPFYLLAVGFWWLSDSLLPDRGISYLLQVTLGLWVVADILAIVFSNNIPDGEGNILRRWL